MVEGVIGVLRGCERVIVVTHVRPDGDAIGSQLALGLFLRQLGKEVLMINAHSVPKNLEWMEGTEDVQVFESSLDQLRALKEADAIVIVDLNSGHRLGTLEKTVRDSPAKKLLIDHHRLPEDWFDAMFIREEEAATAVLVYELIKAWGEDLLKGWIATALYVGILTDTGSFRFPTVTPELHRIVADLLERGVLSPQEVYGAVYDSRSPSWPRLLGRVMNTIGFACDGRLAYIMITAHTLRMLQARSEETEGFVNFAMAVESVEVGIVFLEVSNKGTKVGWRSKGKLAIDGWARSLGGGGHRNAAGVFITRPLKESIDIVLAGAPKFMGETKVSDGNALSPDDAAYFSMLIDA